VLGKVENIEYTGWEALPFIELINQEGVYDLIDIKDLIDMYDVTVSDLANNIDRILEAILLVKDRGAQDITEFMEQLKLNGIVFVDDTTSEGDVRYITVEIPIEARIKLLELLHTNIYNFSMSVDIEKLTGGSLTNVLIQAKYANLDLKAREFIKQISKFVKDYFNFFGISLTNKDIIFNKNLIFNENEKIENVVKSVGVISRESNVPNHPYVKGDIEEELKRLDQEALMYQNTDLSNDSNSNDNNNNNEI